MSPKNNAFKIPSLNLDHLRYQISTESEANLKRREVCSLNHKTFVKSPGIERNSSSRDMSIPVASMLHESYKVICDHRA